MKSLIRLAKSTTANTQMRNDERNIFVPNPIKQHIAVIIRKHTEHGVLLHEVVDELAKEYEELLNGSVSNDRG